MKRQSRVVTRSTRVVAQPELRTRWEMDEVRIERFRIPTVDRGLKDQRNLRIGSQSL